MAKKKRKSNVKEMPNAAHSPSPPFSLGNNNDDRRVGANTFLVHFHKLVLLSHPHPTKDKAKETQKENLMFFFCKIFIR